MVGEEAAELGLEDIEDGVQEPTVEVAARPTAWSVWGPAAASSAHGVRIGSVAWISSVSAPLDLLKVEPHAGQHVAQRAGLIHADTESK